MSETVVPFYIPPAGGAKLGLVRIQDPAVSTPNNELELVVISGGPVFGWFGNVNVNDAYAGSHPSNNNDVEFDFAGNVYHCTYVNIGEAGTMSIASDNETIGYIRIVEK